MLKASAKPYLNLPEQDKLMELYKLSNRQLIQLITAGNNQALLVQLEKESIKTHKMSKLNVLLLLSILAPTQFLYAQNLVPNPSFENYANSYCGIQFPTDFNQIMTDWINPTSASPQVFFTNIADSCYNFQPESLYDGPIGIKGNQSPRTGNVLVGIWSYTIPDFNQRQYVQVELTSPMEIGNYYVVEFYASLGDFMEYSIDKLGAHLSINPPSNNNDGPLYHTPHLLSNDFVDEVTTWVLISDTILAQEAYSTITIGNFFDDNSTNTMSNPSSSGDVGTYGAFYFIDDVRVEEINPLGVYEIQNEDIIIYPTVVTDKLNLKTPIKSLAKIYDSHGQLIISQPITNGLNEINVSSLAKGMYYVSVQNEFRTETRRIIK